jgi:hypothetical protein
MVFTRFALSFVFIFAAGVAALAQESPVTATDGSGFEIYLAKDDGTGKAGEEATSFVTTDIPIYCVVRLDSAQLTTVKMNLVAVAVPGVKADTKVVSTTFTTKDNQDRVNFSGRPAGQWVAGRYRVDIFVGNAAVVSREFAVLNAIQAKPAVKVPAPKSRLARAAVKSNR